MLTGDHPGQPVAGRFGQRARGPQRPAAVQAEGCECPSRGQRLHRRATRLDPAGEVGHVRKRTVVLALSHHLLGHPRADEAHIGEAQQQIGLHQRVPTFICTHMIGGIRP